MALTQRMVDILKAIVDEFVATAEPVGSKTLVDKYGLPYSSATIRNDMAELEKLGLIEKTHTSSGRVPSQKGYRYYVDELVRDDRLTKKEMEIIRDRLETEVNSLEELTKIATNTLSEMTHYTAITISPDLENHNIIDIKFILLGTRVLMAVIMTDSGIIRESVIKFDDDLTQKQVDDLTTLFKSKLVGKPLEIISGPLEEFIMDEIKTGIDIIKKIIEEINKIIINSKQVYLDGANKVTETPEFKKTDIAKDFLNVLDEKEDIVANILNTGEADDINIYIGSESEKEELKNFSIVTFNHIVEGKDIGTIGIIGPTRMDYSKVISVMKYISKKLNDEHKKGKI